MPGKWKRIRSMSHFNAPHLHVPYHTSNSRSRRSLFTENRSTGASSCRLFRTERAHEFAVKFNHLSKETTAIKLQVFCINKVCIQASAIISIKIIHPDDFSDDSYGYVNFHSLNDAHRVVDFIRDTKPQLQGNYITATLRVQQRTQQPQQPHHLGASPVGMVVPHDELPTNQERPVNLPMPMIAFDGMQASTSSAHNIRECNPTSPGTPPYETLVEGLIASEKISLQNSTSLHQPATSSTMPLLPRAMPLGNTHNPLADLPMLSAAIHVTPTQMTPMSSSVMHSCFALNSRKRNPNVVKVHIHGNGITGEELDSYFGQYGKIISKTEVKRGKPNYAYINFDTPINAAKACNKFVIDLKGISLKVIPPCREMNYSSMDHKNIECDKLVTNYAKLKIQEALQSYNSVYVQYKSDGGIDLWCPNKVMHEATRISEEIVKSVQDNMIVEELKLHSCYIPAMLNEGRTLRDLDEVQAQYSFDLSICSQVSGKVQTMPLNEFSKMLSLHGDELTTDSDALANFVTSSSGTVCSKWFWERSEHDYVLYPNRIMDGLSDCSNNPNAQKDVYCKINSRTYRIDLKTMTQTNVRSHQTRRIKQMKSLSPDECQITLQIRTSKESLEKIYKVVKQIFEKSTEEVEVDKLLPQDTDESLQEDLLKLTKSCL